MVCRRTFVPLAVLEPARWMSTVRPARASRSAQDGVRLRRAAEMSDLASVAANTRCERGCRRPPESLYEITVGEVRGSLYVLPAGCLSLLRAPTSRHLCARGGIAAQGVCRARALGASRWRVVRPLRRECPASLAGCTGGLLVALWGVDLFARRALEPSARRRDYRGRRVFFTSRFRLTACCSGLRLRCGVRGRNSVGFEGGWREGRARARAPLSGALVVGRSRSLSCCSRRGPPQQDFARLLTVSGSTPRIS